MKKRDQFWITHEERVEYPGRSDGGMFLIAYMFFALSGALVSVFAMWLLG